MAQGVARTGHRRGAGSGVLQVLGVPGGREGVGRAVSVSGAGAWGVTSGAARRAACRPAAPAALPYVCVCARVHACARARANVRRPSGARMTPSLLRRTRTLSLSRLHSHPPSLAPWRAVPPALPARCRSLPPSLPPCAGRARNGAQSHESLRLWHGLLGRRALQPAAVRAAAAAAVQPVGHHDSPRPLHR